ncbi:MAG: nucleotidyltransferase family protein [Betaproteobacteria bacterium]|nr:nucleotidyltransferase family protein [Betaproteobacteria bacterium]
MIQGLILAAGRSRRFGSDKRLALIDGQAMVLYCALKWLDVMDEVLVILRSEDVELAQHLSKEGITCSHCPQSDLGMGHSLAHGVMQTAHAEGWLIGLADMPQLRASSIMAVMQAARQGQIIVPLCAGKRGHPVYFDRIFGPALMALQGNMGARILLHTHAAVIRELELNDPGVLFDVDFPQQLPFLDCTHLK